MPPLTGFFFLRDRLFRYVWLVAALLSGCAALEPLPAAPPAAAVIEAFHLVGRVSVRYGDDGFSGAIDWRHGPASDEVLILSPLGQGVAQLTRDGSGVTLVTSDQRVFRAQDAESLTEQVLGWRLPLAGLSYWVQAQPRVGSAAAVHRDANGFVDRVTQDGWLVEYSGYREFSVGVLPARIFMDSADLRLKLAVDEWRREP